jgi:hypothetical protein
MSALEKEFCDCCLAELEEGQIGICDDCQEDADEAGSGTYLSALQQATNQRMADHAHHTKRVRWLQSKSPVWACGTPVVASEVSVLLKQSQAYLRDPAGEMNHCNCEPRCSL